MDTRTLLFIVLLFSSLNSVAVPDGPATQKSIVSAVSDGQPAVWGEISVVKTARGHNTVRWTTLEEKGAEHFLVQRAEDGRHFRAIAHISAKGNSRQEVNYKFEDVKAGKKAYYRILVVNEEGKAGYSKVVL